ncbi:ATP-binding protein [Bacillus solimangrovi]|uniref:STAS domain-containing protein n=1 Tax=Bacillus solimangrovi TaxID=1305675 RepID=A0A1E5LFG3_9BACI|nr:ATP-binding protein [Bacillus solimangrovi]OEH92803.1 hypothetical protein BFG57_02075 [Bacillus solimangrovi]
MITIVDCKLHRDRMSDLLNEIIFQIQNGLNLQEDCTLLYNVKLAIGEVLCNIIEHSETNVDNTVDLKIKWTNKMIEIEITDHGDGFDWKRCLQEKMPVPLQIGGRGLIMAKLVSDYLEFDETGKTAYLRFIVWSKIRGEEMINFQEVNQSLQVKINCDINFETTRELEGVLQQYNIEKNIDEINVDFQKVKFIDSTGVSLLVKWIHPLSLTRKIIIHHASDPIKNVFRICKLEQFVELV